MKVQASPGLIQSRYIWKQGTGTFAKWAGAAYYTAALLHWRSMR